MREILYTLSQNYYETSAVIIFGIGMWILLFDRNMIKKLIGINIIDISIFIYFISKGHVEGANPPIATQPVTDVLNYVNPVPTGLMLTGIVVSICMTAFGLALVQKLYDRYGSLDIDAILIERKRKGSD